MTSGGAGVAGDGPRLEALLKRHEGLRLHPYRDTTGHLTIGWGHNLEWGISEPVAALLLREDVARAEAALVRAHRWVRELDPVRKAVLVSMAFNLGLEGLLRFSQTLGAVASGRWADAAAAMRRSQWADQVGARAEELAEMMVTGEWPAWLR